MSDGGQAFPAYVDSIGGRFGMSLRDYFAAQVLPEVYAAGREHGRAFATIDQIAHKAYAVADAMLKVRNEHIPVEVVETHPPVRK